MGNEFCLDNDTSLFIYNKCGNLCNKVVHGIGVETMNKKFVLEEVALVGG